MARNLWVSPTTTVFSTAGNWSLAAAPVNTNDVDVNAVGSILDMLSGLAQSAVTLNSWNQDMSYTGSIGTAASGATATGYLAIGATTFNIGLPASGNGSRRTNITAANSGAVINVLNTGASASDTGAQPVMLITTAAVLNCSGGSVGVAVAASETSSVATLNMTVGASAPAVLLGAGVTLTTGNVIGGTLTNKSSAASTVIVRGAGTLIHQGTGGYTSLTVADGRTVFYNGTGTITALVFGGAGTIDFSGGTGAVTVTTTTPNKGAKIIDPLHRVTFTNQVNLGTYGQILSVA